MPLGDQHLMWMNISSQVPQSDVMSPETRGTDGATGTPNKKFGHAETVS